MWIYTHPVSGPGIQTPNHPVISLLLKPLDQGYRTAYRLF